MIWRDYFSENLDHYFKIFLALVASAFFFGIWATAATFTTVWALLALLMFFIGVGKLHQLLPNAGGKVAVHAVFIIVAFLAAGLAYTPIRSGGQQWSWLQNALGGLTMLGFSGFLTILTSLIVYDEVVKFPYSTRSLSDKKDPI